jgi:hypothetical protein
MAKSRKKTKDTTSLVGLSTEQIEADQGYERDGRAALDLMNRGYHMGGVHSIPREELHERLR